VREPLHNLVRQIDINAASQIHRLAMSLEAEHLDDPRVRAQLHEARKRLDSLLDTAERLHHRGPAATGVPECHVSALPTTSS
jgi:hypothetical protein